LNPVRFIAALFLTLLVAACGAGVEPFGKLEENSGVGAKTVPPIVLAATTGLPSQLRPQLSSVLADEAAARDIIVTGSGSDPKAFHLAGTFLAQPIKGNVIQYTYRWVLTNAAGREVHTIKGDEFVSAPVSGNQWSAATPDVVRRIASLTAESLAKRLGSQGYSTKTSMVDPPLEAFKKAGPGAEKDLDYETIYGPGMIDPNAPPDATAPEEEVANADAPQTGDANEQEAGKSQTPATADSGKAGKPRIKAVAVIPVKGAPGKGNAELTEAMRGTLRDAGWPVVGAPQEDALTIAGSVALAKPEGQNQTVSLSWQVSSFDGKVLGTIKQSNNVPAGSLNQSWGESAGYATEAGANGIFDLIKRYQ